MSTIPSGTVRIPNLLAFSNSQRALASSNRALYEVQNQIYTQRRIVNPSDDPISASLASVLRDRLQTADQRNRNFSHASSVLSSLDQALGEATDLTLQAGSIASSQIGVGSDAETRASEANVIDSLTDALFASANRQYADIHFFGGQRTGSTPFVEFFGGIRYVGSGDGLRTDLGPRIEAPVTIGGEQAFGALSARVKGDVDLAPDPTRATRIADLDGARGEGVTLGSIDVTITNGPPVTVSVDLTGAESIGDVLDRIESTINTAVPGTLAGPFPTSGVNTADDALALSVNAGFSITFADVAGGTTAADLGLSGFTYDNGNPHNTTGDVQPLLSQHTRLGDLDPAVGLTLPGGFTITNGGRAGAVSVAAGDTVGDLARQIDALNLGVRLEINEAGDGLNLVNEVSGFELSVSEDGGGTLLATRLGLRTFTNTTLVDDLNHGRGIEIADGEIDPISGLPHPTRNIDFRVHLQDGNSFDVDLTPADISDVQGILDAVNAAAAGAGFGGVFTATLADGANGLRFEDTSGPAVQDTNVESLNGYAAEDLGLLDTTFSAGAPAVLAGSDRATVRVESVFSDMIDLRDSLTGNDERGIVLAASRLEEDEARLITARAVVGGRAQRVDDAQARTEEQALLDETIRSGLEDLDFAEAATRFSFLQLAQNAAYAATAQTQGLSLLSFL